MKSNNLFLTYRILFVICVIINDANVLVFNFFFIYLYVRILLNKKFTYLSENTGIRLYLFFEVGGGGALYNK